MYKSRKRTSNPSNSTEASAGRAGRLVNSNYSTEFCTASEVYSQSQGSLQNNKQEVKQNNNNMDDLFGDDDITDSMTEEDLQQLENDAWRKVTENKKITHNIGCLDLTQNVTSVTFNPHVASNTARSYPPVTSQRTREAHTVPRPQQQVSYKNQQFQDPQLQQLASQLEEYKLKAQELETSLCTKDGELQVVRNNLDARRKEVTMKAQLIAKMQQEHEHERSERNCKLAQEVKTLRTQLSFQKHELMKQEFGRLQSQNVTNSQNVSNNSQNVSDSHKVSGSVKRKAEFPSTSHGFGLDNSFHSSQIPGGKVPQGKVPRLERRNDDVKVEKILGKQLQSAERKTNLLYRPSTSKMVKPRETKSLTLSKKNPHFIETPSKITTVNSCNSKPLTCQPSTIKIEKPRKAETVVSNSCNNNLLFQSRIVNQPEKRACNLVKKLVLSYSSDSLSDENQDLEVMSLLTLLKYPLKHLPDILKAHSVDKNPDQSLSQFPIWHTQVQAASSDSDNLSTDEEIDFESGKYNLVSQGIFLLLGLQHLSDKNIDTLGVVHVLVFLELYISSYIMTKQRRCESEAEMDQRNIQDPRNLRQGGPTSGDSMNESETQKASFDEQYMILETLQILKLLFYSVPGLVKCVLDRTSPALFKVNTTDEDVVVIYDSNEDIAQTKGDMNEVKGENAEVLEENAVGSFRSLLLKNLQKIVIPVLDDGSSLTVCHAALEVLIMMTSLCNNTELESIFIPLNRGCLLELMAKEDCSISTVSHVMALISNFLPCKNVHNMLCSHTDDCILLKMYQCACDEEDDSGEYLRKFLLQFFQFLMDVASSHGDSVEFLLESDCQCSFEIVRCLVLVLYDKVKYLLDLDVEKVVLDESLPVVRTGINILVILCTHACYSIGHKLHVEHEFSELIYKSMNLFKNIRPYMPELEALALQDLLDMENVDEIEWSSGSETDDDEIMMSH